jgi:hypothetical protein
MVLKKFEKKVKTQYQCIAPRRQAAKKIKTRNEPHCRAKNHIEPWSKMALRFYPAKREIIRGFLCAFASWREDRVLCVLETRKEKFENQNHFIAPRRKDAKKIETQNGAALPCAKP